MRVVLAGISMRAAADSAARAGFDVTAVDAFADLDQHPSVNAQSLGDRFSPDAAARAAQTILCDAVAYGSNFENDPDAVDLLAAGRALWGNPPSVIRRVRDPILLSQTLRRRGFAAPESRIPNPESRIPNLESRVDRAWLVKPIASGGGHRIRVWHPGRPVPPGCYLQELVEGTPGSVVFVAAGGRAVPIGLSRQLIGDAAFGASGYRYCGNILASAAADRALSKAARSLADAIASEFGLIGVNGLDFIVHDGVPHAIEVNPRWCASMELVERAYGLSVFGAHAASCREGVLPDFDLDREARTNVEGKAVVFAKRDLRVGDTRDWLADADVRDVPRTRARIAAGRPICTVFATGRDGDECYAALVRRAELIYRDLAAML